VGSGQLQPEQPQSQLHPTTKETISHTYASAVTNYAAGIDTCCRTGFLLNGHDTPYRLTTHVVPGSANSSPRSNLPATVTVSRKVAAAQPPQTFSVLGFDVDFDNLRYRVASAAEAGTGAPTGISIDPNTGVVSWSNYGMALGYYTMQVIIEDLGPTGGVKTQAPVDFILRLVESVGHAPVFDPPTPGQASTVTFSPGVAQTVEIRTSDVDFGQTVTLNHAGLPSGATFAPTAGNPAVGYMSWTPTVAQSGLSQVVTFYATDDGSPSQQTLRSFTVRVDSPTCTPTPGLSWRAPLSASSTYSMHDGAVLPIRFSYGSCASFIHDESVIILIQDVASPDSAVTAWVYGSDIVIDDTAQEYRQDFNSAWYGLSPGMQLRVQVFVHDALVVKRPWTWCRNARGAAGQTVESG